MLHKVLYVIAVQNNQIALSKARKACSFLDRGPLVEKALDAYWKGSTRLWMSDVEQKLEWPKEVEIGPEWGRKGLVAEGSLALPSFAASTAFVTALLAPLNC